MANEIEKKDSGVMEYVPFAAADKIKLSVVVVQNLVAVKTRSGKTCSQQDAMKFMMLCQAQRLNPFAGDAYLVGYDAKDGTAKFSMITAHAALLKRAEASEDFEGMESGIILKDGESKVTEREGDFYLPDETVVGGWAKVYRRGRKPMYRRLSIAQRRPNYPTPFWEGAKAAEQIVKCSEADALRASFPTLMAGLHTEAEIVQVERTANAVEIPASRLVEVRSRQTETIQEEQPQAEPEGEPEPPAEELSKQSELANIVTGAGFNYDQFASWAKAEKHWDAPDTSTGFDDVPQAVAIRLIRAKAGMLRALQEGSK